MTGLRRGVGTCTSALLDLRVQVATLLLSLSLATGVNVWLDGIERDPWRATRAALWELQHAPVAPAVTALVYAQTGDPQALADAGAYTERTSQLLDTLARGDPATGVRAPESDAERALLERVRNAWGMLLLAIGQLTDTTRAPGPGSSEVDWQGLQVIDGTFAGVTRELLAINDARLHARNGALWHWSLFANIGLTCAGLVASVVMVRTVVRPLRRLIVVIRRLSDDDFEARYGPPLPRGSLRPLARAVDEMAAQFQERRRHRLVLERQVATDPLTELANRRAFFAALELAIARAGVSDEDFLLCYLDVNGFKSINDSLGHMTGDQALVDIAHILRASFRASDVVARLGGDEFATIAFGVSEADAAELRERLEGTLEQFNAFADRPYRLSLSIGIVGYAPMLTADALLQLADEAMYREKHGAPTSEEAA